MKILSVNTGRPRTLEWRGRILTSAIGKEPVAGPVRLTAEGVEGDVQADRRVHGGVDKAVYLYPREHYPLWEEFLGRELAPGALGENLTSTGFLEEELHIGDQVEVGEALLQVSQPRLPCVKLAARYQRADLPKAFTEAGRPGIYFRVLREGRIRAGDEGRVIVRHPDAWSVARVFRLLTGGEVDRSAAARLAALEVLGDGARMGFAGVG